MATNTMINSAAASLPVNMGGTGSSTRGEKFAYSYCNFTASGLVIHVSMNVSSLSNQGSDVSRITFSNSIQYFPSLIISGFGSGQIPVLYSYGMTGDYVTYIDVSSIASALTTASVVCYRVSYV